MNAKHTTPRRATTAAKKTAAGRREDAAHWSTAKKIGIATAAVALPLVAAAIARALVSDRQSAPAKTRRGNAKARRV
jgi:hypothetical protein